jgi:hypothetical protein
MNQRNLLFLLSLAPTAAMAQPALGIQADWNRTALPGESEWRPRLVLDYGFPWGGLRALGSWIESSAPIQNSQRDWGAEARLGPSAFPWNLVSGYSFHTELRNDSYGDREWTETWLGIGAGHLISPILRLEGQALWNWTGERRAPESLPETQEFNANGLVLRLNLLAQFPN